MNNMASPHADLITQFRAEFKTNGEAFKNWQWSDDDGATWKYCTSAPAWNPSYLYRRTPTGHPHAELMKLYAEDAATHERPWELWEVRHNRHGKPGLWEQLNPDDYMWVEGWEYRRKPAKAEPEKIEYTAVMVVRFTAEPLANPDATVDILARRISDMLAMHKMDAAVCFAKATGVIPKKGK
jgi:hypothetical protein